MKRAKEQGFSQVDEFYINTLAEALLMSPLSIHSKRRVFDDFERGIHKRKEEIRRRGLVAHRLIDMGRKAKD